MGCIKDTAYGRVDPLGTREQDAMGESGIYHNEATREDCNEETGTTPRNAMPMQYHPDVKKNLCTVGGEDGYMIGTVFVQYLDGLTARLPSLLDFKSANHFATKNLHCDCHVFILSCLVLLIPRSIDSIAIP